MNMEFFRENWLQIIVGLYLLGMVLYGHYRGLIRLAVSMLALVVTLVVFTLSQRKKARLQNPHDSYHGRYRA